MYIGDHRFGTWRALDANCFAPQMIDRGMCCEVRLYSGEVVKDWGATPSVVWHSANLGKNY